MREEHGLIWVCPSPNDAVIEPELLLDDLAPEMAAHERITSAPANFFGIRERGQLKPGWKADITVFDYNRREFGEAGDDAA